MLQRCSHRRLGLFSPPILMPFSLPRRITLCIVTFEASVHTPPLLVPLLKFDR